MRPKEMEVIKLGYRLERNLILRLKIARLNYTKSYKAKMKPEIVE